MVWSGLEKEPYSVTFRISFAIPYNFYTCRKSMKLVWFILFSNCIFYFPLQTVSFHVQSIGIIYHYLNWTKEIRKLDRSTVAQMAERVAANRKIRGSNPAWILWDFIHLQTVGRHRHARGPAPTFPLHKLCVYKSILNCNSDSLLNIFSHVTISNADFCNTFTSPTPQHHHGFALTLAISLLVKIKCKNLLIPWPHKEIETDDRNQHHDTIWFDFSCFCFESVLVSSRNESQFQETTVV